MEINITSDGFEDAANDARDDAQKINQAAKTNVSESSLSAARNIKLRMPVDTGAARAGWGAEGAAGIWRVEDDGLTIVQGANDPIHYVKYLNEGHSQQAPAGFIDVEHEKAITKFITDMAKDLARIIGS